MQKKCQKPFTQALNLPQLASEKYLGKKGNIHENDFNTLLDPWLQIFLRDRNYKPCKYCYLV